MHHTSGALAQSLTALGAVACGLVLHFVPRESTAASVVMGGVGLMSLVSLVHVVSFFYLHPKMGRNILDHLPTVALCVAAAALFLVQYPYVDFVNGNVPYFFLRSPSRAQWFTPVAFNLVVTALSLRSSGTFVLKIAEAQGARQHCTYNGIDAMSWFWVVALWGAHAAQQWLGVTAADEYLGWLPYIAVAQLAFSGVFDFAAFAARLNAKGKKA